MRLDIVIGPQNWLTWLRRFVYNIDPRPTATCLFGTVGLVTRTPTITIRKLIGSLGELNTATGVRSRTRGEQEG